MDPLTRLFPKVETEQSIAARFERQVALFPGRPAVIEKGVEHTYDALNRLANKIAHRVRAIANGPPTQVAIYMDKGARFLASIMGVLKAGHAYVPIDPAYPRDRNLHIVENSSAKVVLTDNVHAAGLRDLGAHATAVINLDELLDELPDVPGDEQNLGLTISPDALAYIIYTSGSTGRPKGVMQNHRNTLHGCMRRTNLQRITPDDRMTLFYSCSVMGSVYCIFGALLNGAALLPYDFREEGLTDFAQWLTTRRITVFHSVASVFRQFSSGFEGSLSDPSVRLVIFGGEKVFASDIAAAQRIFSERVRFFTGLGSTETGTVRHFLIGPDTTIPSRVVPIGYPVEDVEIVLVDPEGRPVEDGQVGEITVRSKYLALGYWNNEEATRAVFGVVPETDGVRSYRMGDLAVLLPGQMLEHRGRKDFQVKIRGFRVEVGEIEATLQGHPAVAEIAVKAQEIGAETQLVAYVVPRPRPQENTSQSKALSARDLREFVRGKLPSYMVPTVFVGLDALPRTPNGKVDSKALPLPLPINELPDEARVLPATPTERGLVELYTALLRRAEIGANENFFDIGGESLTATQLVSRIQQRFGVKISMRTVFAARDLAELAREIETATASEPAAAADELHKAPADSRIPATPAQRRMWLIDRINPGTAAYNISNTVRLRGPLDVGALERALDGVVRRHEALRTVFRSDADGLWQEVRPHLPIPLPRTDLRHLTETRTERALELVREQLKTAQDLATGPLFSYQLIVLGDEEHILSVAFNHIVYDNIWSSRVFFKEVGALYAFYAGPAGGVADADAAGVLPPLAFQFRDYAAWEQARIDQGGSKAGFDEHLSYWRKQLEAAPDSLDLPTDRRRPNQATFHGGQVSFVVPAEVRLGLMGFDRDHAATMFMSLLATWQLLLHRYSGQDDVLVGTPTGRRYRPETEGMIGLFINNLVMRARFTDGMTFEQLVEQVRGSSIDAFAHDEVPFEALVAELKPNRAGGAPPFFRHFFIHRNATQAAWAIPGLVVEPLGQHQGTSKFDLTLSVLEDEHRLSGTIEYNSDIFDRETIERLAKNYVQLLWSGLEAPSRPIAQLDLLAEAERELVARTWNQTEVAYPWDLRASQLFERQAAAQPDAIAIVSEGQTVSYRELDQRADRMAAALRARGVGPDVLVAVCLGRSPELLVALLGVMKAGGAYVPLDPEYPAERLAVMLEDSQAGVLVSEPGVVDKFDARPPAVILIGDPDEGTAPDAPAPSAPGPETAAQNPDDLAYVIYTSGSTGKPKGVQVTHRGLTNFLCAMQNEPGITASDVLQALTTVCFDIAGLELFLPLTVGARVIISDREVSLSPTALTRSLVDNGVTFLQATPTTWRMLLDSGWTGTPRVKVLCGGEAMGHDLAERLIATGCEIWNVYGPTETTIWSTAGKVSKKEDAGFIGLPIANTQLYVTNKALRVQPIGVPGELMIGGDGLARGYLGRDDLTRDRFVDSPLGSRGRLYHTGDLVARRPDGSIEFLGRSDHQIKIRGFRVELGEIETHLAQHPDVRQTVVVAREDTPGDKRLVAYVVPSGPDGVRADILHLHLKATLPHYMIPAAFVAMDALPLTLNGKVDRKLLPAPAAAEPASKTELAEGAARDDMDRSFLAVWAAALGRSDITIDDDFFALGGDSMKAVELVKEMQKATGIEYPLATLFEAPTIRQLVERGGQEIDRAASIVKLNAVATGVPIYCLAGVQIYKPFADQFKDSPVFGMYAKREVAFIQAHEAGQAIRVPIDALVEAYTDAIARHATSRELVLCGYSFGGILALEVKAALKQRGFDASHVIMFDTMLTGAYQRSVRKVLADCMRMVTNDGPVKTLQVLGKSAYDHLTVAGPGFAAVRLPRPRNGKRKGMVQDGAFKQMRSAYDPTSRTYPFGALLIKATRKELGIGAFLKRDYGIGGMLHGPLKIAEVDADHRGLVQAPAVHRVFEIVSSYLGSPTTDRSPSS